MTTLHVKPIDRAEKGSHWERMTIQRSVLALKQAVEVNDGLAAVTAQLDLYTLVETRCYTDDGTPVVDALREVSEEEFDALCTALLGGGDADGPPSKNGTTPGPTAKRTRRKG